MVKLRLGVYKLINIDNSDSEHAEGNNEPVTSKINYDAVEMLLIDLKKYIAASVLNWNTKMSEFFKKTTFDDVINMSKVFDSLKMLPIELFCL